jgi:hypothetical protein
MHPPAPFDTVGDGRSLPHSSPSLHSRNFFNGNEYALGLVPIDRGKFPFLNQTLPDSYSEQTIYFVNFPTKKQRRPISSVNNKTKIYREIESAACSMAQDELQATIMAPKKAWEFLIPEDKEFLQGIFMSYAQGYSAACLKTFQNTICKSLSLIFSKENAYFATDEGKKYKNCLAKYANAIEQEMKSAETQGKKQALSTISAVKSARDALNVHCRNEENRCKAKNDEKKSIPPIPTNNLEFLPEPAQEMRGQLNDFYKAQKTDDNFNEKSPCDLKRKREDSVAEVETKKEIQKTKKQTGDFAELPTLFTTDATGSINNLMEVNGELNMDVDAALQALFSDNF